MLYFTVLLATAFVTVHSGPVNMVPNQSQSQNVFNLPDQSQIQNIFNPQTILQQLQTLSSQNNQWVPPFIQQMQGQMQNWQIPSTLDDWNKQLPQNLQLPVDQIQQQLAGFQLPDSWKQGFAQMGQNLPLCTKQTASDFLTQLGLGQQLQGASLDNAVNQLLRGPREFLLILGVCQK